MAVKPFHLRLIDADRDALHADIGFDQELGEMRFGGDAREADVLHSQHGAQLLDLEFGFLRAVAVAVV